MTLTKPDQQAPWQPSGDGLPTYQEIIRGDAVPPPEGNTLREVSWVPMGSEGVSKDRYISQEYLDREVEQVWKRTWQPVCHEAQLLKVGDVHLYDVVGLSVLVTRVGEDSIKAFHNSCLHRGTQLRLTSGRVESFRCPFHNFTWNVDGTFASMPCEWDFSHIDKESFCLPELQVATWAGFVFVNPDLTAPPLAEYLGPIVDQFRAWRPEDRVPLARVTKPIPGNWKVATEAFIETMHVVGIHPQVLARTGDSNAQYDVYEHFSRMLVANNVPSPHLVASGQELSEQEIVDRVLAEDFAGLLGDQDQLASMLGEEVAAMFADGVPDAMTQVPEGYTARAWLAQFIRMQLQLMGTVPEGTVLSDAELSDAIEYLVFPNFNILGGFGFGLAFWFRPVDEANPDECILEMFLSRPGKWQTERTPIPTTYHLTAEDRVAKVKELGGGANLFEQDIRNMPRVQRGLKKSPKDSVTLADYSELRIRHLNALLDQYMVGE